VNLGSDKKEINFFAGRGVLVNSTEGRMNDTPFIRLTLRLQTKYYWVFVSELVQPKVGNSHPSDQEIGGQRYGTGVVQPFWVTKGLHLNTGSGGASDFFKPIL